MKNLIVSIFLIVNVSYLSAQSSQSSPFKLSSVNFLFGDVADYYQKLDLDAMRSISTNQDIFFQDLDGYTENLWRESWGMRISLDAEFRRFNALGQEYDRNKMVRFGLSYSEREPAISYDKVTIDSNGMRQVRNSIIYCNTQNEINLTGAYIWKTGGNKKRIVRFYAGAGGNVGFTHSDQMIIMESTSYSVKDSIGNYYNYNRNESETDIAVPAKTALFFRGYVPAGIELNMWKAKLALEGSASIGVHQLVGGKTYFMPFGYSVSIRLGVNF